MNNSLVTLLKARGLRLADLATRLEVDKATVTRWAQKSVPVGRVSDVSRVTGIPVEKLRPDLAGMFAGPKRRRAA